MPLLVDDSGDSGTPVQPPPSLPTLYPDQPGVLQSASSTIPQLSFGDQERSDMAQPYAPFTPQPLVPGTENPAPGNPLADMVSNIPLVGGAFNYAANQIHRGPFYTAFGGNPDVTSLPPEQQPQAIKDVFQGLSQNAALGLVGGMTNEEAQIAGGLAGRIGAKPGRLGAGEAFADTSAAQQAAGKSLAEEVVARQEDVLRAGGATEDDIANFRKTMAPVPEKKPYTTVQGGEIDFGKMTRAIQTALGHDEGAGMPELLKPYSTSGKFAPADLTRHGGVVGAAGRALLAGDEDVLQALPPELSQKLIQGKIAQMARDAGVSEDALRAAFPVSESIPAEVRASIREDLSSGEISAETRTRTEAAAQTVLSDAGIPANPVLVQAVADKAIADAKTTNRIASAFNGKTAEAAKFEETIRKQAEAQGIDVNAALKAVGLKPGRAVGGGERPPAEPPAPPTGGATPPAGTPQEGRSLLRTAEEIAGIPKSLLVSAAPFHGLLRHGLPFAVAHPKAWGAGWTGGWNALRSTPEEVAGRLSELRGAVDANGGKRLYLGMPHGGIASGEEAAASNLINRVPVLGSVTQRMGQSFTQSLNEVRAAAFNGLVNGARESGAPFSQQQIDQLAETINHFSGRGFRTDTQAKAAFARAANTAFFSPELQVSRIRMWTDTLGGIADLTRNPSDPIAREKVRLGVGYLAGVAGMYALAQMAGMNVSLDPRSSRGFKIDIGPRSDAAGFLSSLASEIGMTTQVLAGRVFADPTAGESTYIRALARILTNSTVTTTGKEESLNTQKFGGQTSTDVLGALLEGKLSPAVSEMLSALNRQGIDWSGLGMPLPIREYLAGSGKITNPQFGTEPKRDAVGRLDDGTLPIDPVLDAWKQVQDASAKKADGQPSFANLNVPTRSIGTGTKAIQLDDKELDRYQELVGQSRANIIGQIISSPQWATLGQADKEKRLAGAKTEADRQGQIAFGIEHAQQATDDLGRTRGALIALETAGTDIGRRMDVVGQLSKSGTLNQTVKDAIDEQRAHKDPLASGYEMTVDQYLNGSQLVQRYLTTPPYRFGTSADWAQVTDISARLQMTYDAIRRQAEMEGKKVVQMAAYRQTYLPEYQQARVGGIPISRYLDTNGTIRQTALSPQRVALEADPLWKHFMDVAKKRDPYTPKTK